MSLENREEILADFQACTGIDDVTEAIHHLDETNWDLLSAVSRVMPPDSQSFNQASRLLDDPVPAVVADADPATGASLIIIDDDDDNVPAVPVEMATTDMIPGDNDLGLMIPQQQQHRNKIAIHHRSNKQKNHIDDNNRPSTSNSKSTVNNHNKIMLKFNVQYSDRIITVNMPDTATIADLKIQLYKQLKIAPCRQLLSGWARQTQYENTPFSTLMLPKENGIHLTIKPNEGGFTGDEEPEVTEKLNGLYLLNIKFDDKTYSIKFKGTNTILDVKTGIYNITNVQVRNQAWNGWPPNIDDQTMLAVSGISYPEHDLIVARINGSNKDNNKEAKNIIQIDSEDDEYEDAAESFNGDDEYFVDNMTAKRTEPLIPENIDDELIGSITFTEQFTARYGPIHPAFYQGTLDEAVKEACSKPAADRKILAIYLHHDASVLTNVFCTQLLGYESVMQMFENNFVLWGWDLTFETNRTRFQTSLQNTLGATASMGLRTIPVERLPAIILIIRIRSSTDILKVIHGNVGVNELLSSLIEAAEMFTKRQRVEVVEEKERAEREFVKWEQDEAYRESLETDRAKDEAKRQQAQAESDTKKRIEREVAQKEAEREAHRRIIEASLPPEPPIDDNNIDSITKIRFRLPKGENIERRFHVDTSLNVLLDFLTVKGYPSEEYKVISSWPRRDLTSLNRNSTLKQLNLCPQETVILEER